MTIHRRSFITGLVSLVAAPAIVRAGSLMPVKVMPDPAALAKAMVHYAEDLASPPLMEGGLTIEKIINAKRWMRATRYEPGQVITINGEWWKAIAEASR